MFTVFAFSIANLQRWPQVKGSTDEQKTEFEADR